jgi:hypothetical protein
MGGYTSKCEKKSKSLHLSADPLRGQVEGGLSLEIETFLGLVTWHQAVRQVPFLPFCLSVPNGLD